MSYNGKRSGSRGIGDGQSAVQRLQAQVQSLPRGLVYMFPLAKTLLFFSFTCYCKRVRTDGMRDVPVERTIAIM